jgi:hypothetical protein
MSYTQKIPGFLIKNYNDETGELVSESFVELENLQSVPFTLKDVYQNSNNEVSGKIEFGPYGLLLSIDGYGDCVAGARGYPVVIENREDVVHVVVWASIKDEEPVYQISLADAKEELI